jgi:ribosomal protein S24E
MVKITIKEKKENHFLKRIEIKGEVAFENATLSNAQLIEALARELSKEAELIVVKNIYTKFGRKEADFTAVIYGTKEGRMHTEKKAPHEKKKEKAAAGAGGQ